MWFMPSQCTERRTMEVLLVFSQAGDIVMSLGFVSISD